MAYPRDVQLSLIELGKPKLNTYLGSFNGLTTRNPMNSYEFQIEEVKREGYIAWDAVAVPSKARFPVNASEPYAAGNFPEITTYLAERGVDFQVTYSESHQDKFDGATWRYVRGDTEVVVHDIPRTIVRISTFR